MPNYLKNSFDIDVVILWVDGNDENHINKISQYIENKNLLKSKGFLTRYLQVDEIEYCVKSINKFASYVRTIYIVTDEQIPDFLRNSSEYKNVKIIDHKAIFNGYEEYLPTFNCYPIETMMSRISGLAEHFIYFNDDMFLMQETKPTDFFNNDGYPVIRGKWSNFESVKFKNFLIKIGFKKKRVSKIGYKKAQENSAKILGLKKYLRLSHTPFPIRKSVFNDYLKKNPDVLINNIKNRFRDPSYFMIQSHVAHLEVLNKSYQLKKSFNLVHFGSSDKPLFWIKLKLFLNLKNPNKLFLNIQSLDLYPPKKIEYILNWLNSRLS